ncbi:MAG: hypothetical protein ABW224_14220 [Kibdelosporangium sp.]
MNEQQLREGLREVLVASSPPPSMNPNEALDSARRAHKRRRATYTGAAAGVAVVVMAAGTMFALSPGDGTPLPLDPAAAPPPASAPGADTKPAFPNGQPDRTATAGPEAAKGDALLASLKTQLPDTLSVNTTITHPGSDPSAKQTVTASQSQFVDYIGGDKTKQIWEYSATVAVNTKAAPGAGTGRVLVETVTPGDSRMLVERSADVCALARSFWAAGGTCETRQVQGKTVGVITKSEDPRIDQVVAYRHDDGTTVAVAQSRQPDNTGDSTKPADGSMAQPPLTVDQLATLVLSPAFKIS